MLLYNGSGCIPDCLRSILVNFFKIMLESLELRILKMCDVVLEDTDSLREECEDLLPAFLHLLDLLHHQEEFSVLVLVAEGCFDIHTDA